VHYGERVKLPRMPTRTRGLVEFFFFFFFFYENTLGGKIFEFPPKRFRDSWLARGDVDHLMRRIAWSRFGHVSELEWSKGGCHNYRPDVGSRSVFGNYEASFSVLRSVFSGF
jgi:hypothetical protein